MPKTKEPLYRGKRKANAEEWARVEAEKDPEDFPRLVAAIREAQSPTAAQHVNQLSTRVNEPRLVEALLDFLRKPPYAGGQSKKFYNEVIAGLVATNSDAAREGMDELSKKAVRIFGSFMGDWMASRLTTTVKKMTPKGAPAKPKPKATALTALFEEIVAHPDDDGPRLVYADALTEKGDARGEFITLQLVRAAGKATAKQMDRERVLLSEDKSIDKLAAPLQTAAEAVTFERGFPYAIFLKKTGLQTILDEPAWGTVRKVLGIEYAPVTAAVKLLENAPNLLHVGTLDENVLGKLKKPSYPWTTVELDATSLARFPQLKSLVLRTDEPMDAGLLADTAIERLTLATSPTERIVAPRLRAIRFDREASPDVVEGLAIAELAIDSSVKDAAAWLAAAPAVTKLEIDDNIAFKSNWGWAALKQLLASRLESLTVKRWSGTLEARFERGPKGWTLVWPCAQRWSGAYEEIAGLAKRMREAGVTAMTLYPEEPRHFAKPFEDTDKKLLDAIDKAWKPIVVEKPDADRWPRGEAPQEGWALNRQRRIQSR